MANDQLLISIPEPSETVTALRAAREMARVDTPTEFGNALLSGVTSLVQCETAGFSVPNDSGGVTLQFSSREGIGRVDYHSGGLGSLVVRTGRPFATTNYLQDQRIQHDSRTDLLMRREATSSLAAVPFFSFGALVGVVSVGKSSEIGFGRDVLETMTAFSELASAAFERVQRAEETRRIVARADSDARLLALHRLISELTVERRPLEELVRTLANNFDAAVVLSRAGLSVSDEPAGGDGAAIRRLEEFRHSVGAEHVDRPVDLAHLEPSTWGLPLSADGRRWSLIIRPRSEGAVRRDDLAAIASVLTAYLVQHQEHTTARTAATDLVTDLLDDPLPDVALLRRQARELGVDPMMPATVLALEPKDSAISERIARLVGTRLFADYRGATVFVLPGAVPQAQLDGYARELRFSVMPGSGFGAATASTLFAIHSAAEEAQRFRAIGSTTGGLSVHTRESVGIVGLLATSHGEGDALDASIDELVGPVLEYDLKRNSSLVQSLETYLDVQANHLRAANLLHVHSNTLYRRLERVDELIGTDWREGQRSLEVRLALKLARTRGGRPV